MDSFSSKYIVSQIKLNLLVYRYSIYNIKFEIISTEIYLIKHREWSARSRLNRINVIVATSRKCKWIREDIMPVRRHRNRQKSSSTFVVERV